MDTGGFTRGAAAAGLVGAALQIVGGVVETVDRILQGAPGFALRTWVIGGAYLLLMTLVIGLARSGVAGAGVPARTGLVAASLGWALAAVAQIVLQINFTLAVMVLFPVSTVMIGVGMLVAGVGVLRARRWSGPSRFVPLLCGMYPLAMIPIFAILGGPNFLVLAGQGVCWALLALAPRASARAGQSASAAAGAVR